METNTKSKSLQGAFHMEPVKFSPYSISLKAKQIYIFDSLKSSSGLDSNII